MQCKAATTEVQAAKRLSLLHFVSDSADFHGVNFWLTLKHRLEELKAIIIYSHFLATK